MSTWWQALPRGEWTAFDRVLPECRWFEVYRVLPDVYAIYEPGHFEEVISFLIIGRAKALLFDTGLGLAPIAPVIHQLTDKPITVINSHSHYDHVGGNHEFDRILGLEDPFYHKSAGGLRSSRLAAFVNRDCLPTPPRSDFDREHYWIRPWAISGTIADGDVIELGGRSLEIIETPGESPDGLCLLDRTNRLLFVGDLFYLGPLYAHLPESEIESYRWSVDRIALLEPQVDCLLTSHNVPMVEAGNLSRLRAAFSAIEDGTAPCVKDHDTIEYRFDGFSILVAAKLRS